MANKQVCNRKGEAGEPLAEERDDSHDLWEVIQSLIPDERELRVAYLIFHCGLKPSEIVHFCSEEFCGVKEIAQWQKRLDSRCSLETEGGR